MNMFKRLALPILILCTFSCKSQQRGSAISTDSTAIFFRAFGSGKPLLIINGGPGMNSEGFADLALKLSKKRQTIIYDQRGTGKSTVKSLDSNYINMKLMMDDIESLRKHLKIENWDILGHSFGGMLASYYATKYAENIDKIVLSSSGGIDLELLDYVRQSINSHLTQNQLDSIDYWVSKLNAGDTSHFVRLQRGKLLAPAYVFDSAYFPIIAERLTQGNTVINQLIWTDMQRIGFDCAPGLKDYEKPVLIIQGKQDIVKAETAEKAHRAFKNSKVVFMDNCIHYGWLDNEQWYFSELSAFLDS